MWTTKYYTFDGIPDISKEMDDLAKDIQSVKSFFRSVNHKIEHDKNTTKLTLELPGVSPELLNVSIDEKSCLNVSWEKDGAKRFQKFNVEGFDTSNIDASLQLGILTIVLQKKNISQAKKIDVNVR